MSLPNLSGLSISAKPGEGLGFGAGWAQPAGRRLVADDAACPHCLVPHAGEEMECGANLLDVRLGSLDRDIARLEEKLEANKTEQKMHMNTLEKAKEGHPVPPDLLAKVRARMQKLAEEYEKLNKQQAAKEETRKEVLKKLEKFYKDTEYKKEMLKQKKQAKSAAKATQRGKAKTAPARGSTRTRAAAAAAAAEAEAEEPPGTSTKSAIDLEEQGGPVPLARDDTMLVDEAPSPRREPTSPLPSDGEESPKSLVRKPKAEYVTMPDGRVERDPDESHSPERLKMVAFAVKTAKEQNPSLSAADEAKIVDINNQFNKLTLQEYIQILQSEGLLQ